MRRPQTRVAMQDRKAEKPKVSPNQCGSNHIETATPRHRSRFRRTDRSHRKRGREYVQPEDQFQTRYRCNAHAQTIGDPYAGTSSRDSSSSYGGTPSPLSQSSVRRRGGVGLRRTSTFSLTLSSSRTLSRSPIQEVPPPSLCLGEITCRRTLKPGTALR